MRRGLPHQDASPSSPTPCARTRATAVASTAAASTRQVVLGHQPVGQQNNTKGSLTPAPRAPMGNPSAADTRNGVCQQTRAVRAAGAALPRRPCPRSADLKQARQMFQNRDAMGGAAPRPSISTMVLCTGTRGSLVRCPLRQRRPGRAARAAGRRTRSLPDSLRDSLRDFRKGKLARIFRPKKYQQYQFLVLNCDLLLQNRHHGTTKNRHQVKVPLATFLALDSLVTFWPKGLIGVCWGQGFSRHLSLCSAACLASIPPSTGQAHVAGPAPGLDGCVRVLVLGRLAVRARARFKSEYVWCRW